MQAWISCGDLAKASTAFDFANDALTHARSCDAVSMTRPQNAEKEYSFWTTRSKAVRTCPPRSPKRSPPTYY